MNQTLAVRLIAVGVCVNLLLWSPTCVPVGSAQEDGGDSGTYADEELEYEAWLDRGRQAERDEKYEAALAEYKRAAELSEDADAQTRATIQYRIGIVYRKLNQHEIALSAYRRALEILGSTSESGLRSKILNAQGRAYRRLQRHVEATESFQQEIDLLTAAGNFIGQARAYGNLGGVYQAQSQFALALSAYRNALSAAEKADDAPDRLTAGLLADIGLVHSELGDYEAALSKSQSSIDLLQKIFDAGTQDKRLRSLKGRVLHNMAFAYFRSGEITRSIEFYGRALSLREDVGDRLGESRSLNSLGFAYAALGQHEQALANLERAIAITREERDRRNEGRTLDSIASVYMQTGQHGEALKLLYEAMVIKQEVDDRGGQQATLANIGRVFLDQGHTQLAIVFLKKSVEMVEQIKVDLGTLPKSMRQAYTDSVADTYRLLADLLLREDRIVEAERVIDLLRVEELDEFLGGVRSGDANVYLRSEEEQAWSEYAKMMQRSVTQGRELAQLLEDLEDRDPTVDAKIRELTAEMVEINTAFVEFNEDPEVVSAFDDLSPKSRDQSISPAHLVQLSQAIEGDAALFYPLILPDRLELVLATTYSLPIHIPIDVSEDELKDAIWEFRNALTGEPGYDPKVLGQKLYRWLIAPLEGALAAAEINRIIYIPDGPLRYVPLAALHDGENWLIRRYQINLITAMSLTNFSPTTRPISKVLAGAFPSEAIEVDVAGSRYLLEGLPFARQEVEDIASIYPDSSTFFGDEFSPQNLVPFFSGYQVVHLATHGRFVPGRPADESFILFGNGERTTLPEIKNSWLLRNIDLVVLSACETGLGGKLENGEEFLGFGYLMQNAGAKAIIASLWSVSDGGTQALMTAFYRYINQPGMSMADALRQAQLALIDDKHDVDGAARGVNLVEQPQAPKDFAHPVFWAPFVLIGNGL